MGHYLSETESDSEHYYRTVIRPMRAEYQQFLNEQERGLLHSGDWLSKMERSKKTLAEKGYF